MKLEVVVPWLNERQRRLLYAAEARQLGHGGIAAVSTAAGVSRGCVHVEALATKSARVYGRWARSVAAEDALEYVDAGGHRAHAVRFRTEAFAAVADYLGITGLPPRPLDSSRPMWDQARAVAYDVVKAEGPAELRAMCDLSISCQYATCAYTAR
ncbi:hypothetical protein ACFWOJ_35235 [Streptomyces sp. NPDC058439]|uniref:hypothetical protein n=1 Tax=Streptomyces sp. NPDC058439 TaxID=3346500 RepID=UPI00366537CE